MSDNSGKPAQRRVVVAEGETPVKLSPPPASEEQAIDSLYTENTIHERTIGGVTFKLRELSGKSLIDISDRCSYGDPSNPRMNKGKMSCELIRLSVVKPEKLDVERLKPSVFTALAGVIDEINGLSEVAAKNLGPESKES